MYPALGMYLNWSAPIGVKVPWPGLVATVCDVICIVEKLPNRWMQPLASIRLVVETESFCAGKYRKPIVRQPIAIADEVIE